MSSTNVGLPLSCLPACRYPANYLPVLPCCCPSLLHAAAPLASLASLYWPPVEPLSRVSSRPRGLYLAFSWSCRCGASPPALSTRSRPCGAIAGLLSRARAFVLCFLSGSSFLRNLGGIRGTRGTSFPQPPGPQPVPVDAPFWSNDRSYVLGGLGFSPTGGHFGETPGRKPYLLGPPGR